MQTNPRNTYDKAGFIKAIKEMLPQSDLLSSLLRTYNKGQMLLREGEFNDCLHIILEGFTMQVKENEGEDIDIDIQGPGGFIGLLSFQTGEPVFTSVRAKTQVSTLSIDHDNFDRFLNQYPEISKTLQGLIFSNLSERYRRVVTLHLEVAILSRELEKERNHLQKAIQELEHTRNAMVSQEKMAILGELTAGLAHEMNNPASALLRSVDYLMLNLPVMLQRASHLPDTGQVRYFFEYGTERQVMSTTAQRDRMKVLQTRYPGVSRSNIRIMAEMNDELLNKLEPFIGQGEKQELFQLLLEAYQSGVFLTSIRLSTSRIEDLVKSLKSYSRQTGTQPEPADIRAGIRETLLILGNRLNDIQLEVNLHDIPAIKCFVGELNQVWTNLIINACDAMNNRGKLFVSCGWDEQNRQVWVKIADNGPGVDDAIKKRIFDSSFTTKTAGGDFGLGIGLAISKGIIEKHLGCIDVFDRQGGGAEFRVLLPAD